MAVAAASRFLTQWASYRYDQDPAGRAAALAGLLTPDSQVDLAAATPVGAAREQMVAQRWVSTATAKPRRLLLLSTSTVVVEVAVTKTTSTTASPGPTVLTVGYQVTMGAVPGGWGVRAVQPPAPGAG